MIIEIVNAALADEKGLGSVYRVEQLRDGVPWVHLIARTAVATDMELFGIDNPATVIEWHLYEAFTSTSVEPSPADQLAFEAQQLAAAVLTARTRLTAANPDQPADTRLAADLSAAQEQADTMRDQARDMKTAEINQVRQHITVADNEGFAELCNLASGDETDIDADRTTYRDRITNPVTV